MLTQLTASRAFLLLGALLLLLSFTTLGAGPASAGSRAPPEVMFFMGGVDARRVGGMSPALGCVKIRDILPIPSAVLGE